MSTTSTLMVIAIATDETDEEIIDYMRIMKKGRESSDVKEIICTIGGYDKDPRPLVEIPEVRTLCRRLVDLGFISYLTLQTTVKSWFGKKNEPGLDGGWGAIEVIICAENFYKGEGTEVTKEKYQEWVEMVKESNVKADKLLGPINLSKRKP